MFQIVFLVIASFLLGTVPADGADVEHSCPVLNECASFDGDVEIGDVSQAEIDELLEFPFSQEILDGCCGERLFSLKALQPILCEGVINKVKHYLKNPIPLSVSCSLIFT